MNRPECEAEITRHHATYTLACEVGDKKTADEEQARVNALIDQWSSIPQQRRP